MATSDQRVGLCVGGSNHGQMVSNWGDYLKLPVVDTMPDLTVGAYEEIPSEFATYSVEEYHWTTMDFRSGPVSFWRHSSLESRADVLRALIEIPI